MFRVLVIAAIAYGYGSPGLESLRPGAVDRAFGGFHKAVNEVIGRQRIGPGLATQVALGLNRSFHSLPLVDELGGMGHGHSSKP